MRAVLLIVALAVGVIACGVTIGHDAMVKVNTVQADRFADLDKL